MKAAEIFEGETHGGAVGKAMGKNGKSHGKSHGETTFSDFSSENHPSSTDEPTNTGHPTWRLVENPRTKWSLSLLGKT